jgi:hypothetical protein
MLTATITSLTEVDGRYWLARVADGTDEIVVDNRIGPWTTPVDPHADHSSNQIPRRELVPEVSAALRELVRTNGTEAVVSYSPARRPRALAPAPVPTPTAVQSIAQQMAAAGAAAIRKAA